MAPIFVVLISVFGFVLGVLLVIALIDGDHNNEDRYRDLTEDQDVDGGFYDDWRLP